MTTGGGLGGGNANGGGNPANGGGDQPAVPWGTVEAGKVWTIGDKPWYDVAVPEGPARELIKAKNYANPAVVATSYAELERINSSRDDSKMIRIPDENAKPEDWRNVYERLGAPKTVDGYKDVKWGENADPAMVEFGKNLAFKMGIPPKMAETVMAGEWNKFIGELNAKAKQDAETQFAADLAKIKAEWKGDFDANQARGQQVIKALGNAGFSEADLASVEQHIGVPAVVKLLATIGKLSGEGGLPMTTGGGNNSAADPSTLAPEQAVAEIKRLATDDAFQKVYMNGADPGQKAAADRMKKLYEKAGALMGAARA